MSARAYGPRTCERCGKTYVPTSANQRYCCATCKAMSRRSQDELDREALGLAREAVGALGEAQRARLRAMVSGARCWKGGGRIPGALMVDELPETVTAFDGRDIRTYLPMVVATRVVRATDDGTGTCTCSACGRHVEPSWKWCAHCMARFDGTRYEGVDG